MTDHVYKSLELTGTSERSIEDAVSTALKRASKTMRNIRWVEVKDVRGHVESDRIAHWQVTMKVGFTLEE
jgi:flavin-binding protein dodecin